MAAYRDAGADEFIVPSGTSAPFRRKDTLDLSSTR